MRPSDHHVVQTPSVDPALETQVQLKKSTEYVKPQEKTGVCKNYLLVFYLLLVNHLARPRVVLAAQPHYMGYCVVIIKQEAQNHRADTTRRGQRKTTSEIGPWRTGAQQDINNWSPTHLILQTALRPGPQHETRGVEPINSIKNTR